MYFWPVHAITSTKCSGRSCMGKSLGCSGYDEEFVGLPLFWIQGSCPEKRDISRVQGVGFRRCFQSCSHVFELRLQLLAICYVKVATIWVTKLMVQTESKPQQEVSLGGPSPWHLPVKQNRSISIQAAICHLKWGEACLNGTNYDSATIGCVANKGVVYKTARRVVYKLPPRGADNLDTEYDWAKVPPYNGNDPRPPLVV